MIQLNEGICYSPQPNSAYRYVEFVKSGGLAAFFGDDLQMWNLAWVTDPIWDRCLDVKSSKEVRELLKATDTTMVGLVKRALTVGDDIEDWGTPTLRSLLMLPPREFMRQFSKKDINCLELTATYGQPLIQTMWSRARLGKPATGRLALAEFVERATGKVISLPMRQTNDESNSRAARSGIAGPSKLANAVTEVKSGVFEVIESSGANSLQVPTALELTTDVIGEAVPYQTANDQFIDNGDGTVTDATTGLTWMRCASGQTWNGATCIGDATKVSWDVASRLQQDFAGFCDWRLPSIEELKTLVDAERAKPPATFDLMFPKTPPSVFWSSTVWAEYPAFAWGVNFEHGDVGDHHRDYANCHVRLVRSVPLSHRDDEPKDRAARIAVAVSSKPTNAVAGIKPDVLTGIESKTDSSVPVVTEQDSFGRAEELINRLEALESKFISALGRMESLLEDLTLTQTAVRAVVDPVWQDPPISAADLGELHRKLTNAVQVEMLKRGATGAIQRPASSATYTSLQQLLHGLIELKDISLVELRRHLLPLDLLPGAVVEQVNEKAFDLVGEAALEEDGERVIVCREVLAQVLKTWNAPSA